MADNSNSTSEMVDTIGKIFDGVGPDAAIIENDLGGRQSDSPARLDLMPPLALMRVGEILKAGAEKIW